MLKVERTMIGKRKEIGIGIFSITSFCSRDGVSLRKFRTNSPILQCLQFALRELIRQGVIEGQREHLEDSSLYPHEKRKTNPHHDRVPEHVDSQSSSAFRDILPFFSLIGSCHSMYEN